jgi:predicted dehydrogenase
MVRVAVVGLGYWGPNLVRALHEVPSADPVAICDADSDRLRHIARRYPALRLTTEFDSLLDDREVDAVVLATPVASHYSLALAALEAGKHVFVEKPMAASSVEAEDLADLADRRGLTLMPGHTFLYSPPVNYVHQLITSGELGEIHFISTSRVNLGLHQSDASVLWDLGPHDLSILRFWLGENPVVANAAVRSCVIEDVPDVAFINLKYPSGTLAHVELSWLAPSKLRRTAIVGSRKMVVYDDTSPEPVRIFDSGVALPDPSSFGEYQLSYRTGDIVSPAVSASEPLVIELADFCDAALSGRPPRSSASLGVDVVRAIELIEASLGAFA